MDPEQAPAEQPSPAFSLAGALHGVRTLLFGPCTGPTPGKHTTCPRLEQLQHQVEMIEDRFQSYRLEMSNLVSQVEDTLELATKRHGRARAAESRANKEVPDDGAPDLASDPEAYRAALNRGGMGG